MRKGGTHGELHSHPSRLLQSQKRTADGFRSISSSLAMDEIAAALELIRDRYEARVVASYFGMGSVANCLTEPFLNAFMHAFGSPMYFSANTLDKPGKALASALHGSWMAPRQGYSRPDVALLVGLGVACGHPGQWLGEQLQRGMQLIVIDPRVSDIARRASIHLQPMPGNDVAILASLVHVILGEDLYDHEFVGRYAAGVDALAAAVTFAWATEPGDLFDADLVGLPGSKLVPADLAWAHRVGTDTAIRDAHERSVAMLALCGGIQFLGGPVHDPHGVELAAEGLRRTSIVTTFGATQVGARRDLSFASEIPARWSALSERKVAGYEVRFGQTEIRGSARFGVPVGLGFVEDKVLGMYLHRLVENPGVLTAITGRHPRRGLGDVFDGLADLVDEHLDLDAILGGRAPAS